MYETLLNQLEEHNFEGAATMTETQHLARLFAEIGEENGAPARVTADFAVMMDEVANKLPTKDSDYMTAFPSFREAFDETLSDWPSVKMQLGNKADDVRKAMEEIIHAAYPIGGQPGDIRDCLEGMTSSLRSAGKELSQGRGR